MKREVAQLLLKLDREEAVTDEEWLQELVNDEIDLADITLTHIIIKEE